MEDLNDRKFACKYVHSYRVMFAVYI